MNPARINLLRQLLDDYIDENLMSDDPVVYESVTHAEKLAQHLAGGKDEDTSNLDITGWDA